MEELADPVASQVADHRRDPDAGAVHCRACCAARHRRGARFSRRTPLSAGGDQLSGPVAVSVFKTLQNSYHLGVHICTLK